MLTADADATIASGAPGTNAGSATYLDVSRVLALPNAREWRSLAHFNLAALPAWSAIDSAVLELYQTDAGTGASVRIYAMQIVGAWSEGDVTWNNQPGDGGGVSVPVNQNTGWKSWDLTSMAKSWLSAPASNHGVILIGPAGPFGRTFSSREGAHPPRLRVTYHNCSPH